MAHLFLLISLSLFISLTSCQNDTTLESSSTRIVGGSLNYEPTPYQISFQIFSNNKWRHFCGGSIISPNFMITAAHCVNGKDSTKLSVLAGITNLKSEYGSRHYVEGYQMHEGFVPLRKCDIAIVKVTPPFQLNQITIDAISFTNPIPVKGGVPVILTGWGSTKQNGSGPLPDDLQVLTTNTLYNSDCQNYFPKLEATEICTLRQKQFGACKGDSGGPLVNYERNQVIGVVAFGTLKCANGYPDVFTRVSEFSGWISDKMVQPWAYGSNYYLY